MVREDMLLHSMGPSADVHRMVQREREEKEERERQIEKGEQRTAIRVSQGVAGSR